MQSDEGAAPASPDNMLLSDVSQPMSYDLVWSGEPMSEAARVRNESDRRAA